MTDTFGLIFNIEVMVIDSTLRAQTENYNSNHRYTVMTCRNENYHWEKGIIENFRHI